MTIQMGGRIAVRRNRDQDLNFTVQDDSDPAVAINLTGATAWHFVVKGSVLDADAKAFVDKTAVTVTDATLGKVTVSLVPTDTTDKKEFPAGVDRPAELYYLDSASKKRTAWSGTVYVEENVYAT